MGRKRLTRRIGVMVGLLLVVVLAACDTQPATDITAQQATLNAKGACVAGMSGQLWFQMRNVTTGSGWWDATPRTAFNCSADTGEMAFQGQRVSDLQPENTYQFRLATTVNGAFHWYDSGGAQDGGNYDSLRTQGVMDSVAEYPPGPDEVNDPTACTGTEACDSAVRKAKYDLKNTYHSWFRSPIIPDFEWWGARVTTDWGYTLGPYIIRWRRSDPSFWISSPYGDVTKTYEAWHTSQCYTPGPDSFDTPSCLTRREYQVRLRSDIVTAAGTIHINSYQWGCIGTRIYGNGGHHRNAWGDRCDDPPNASSARVRRAWTKPTDVEGKPARGIEDFVSERVAKKIKRVCWAQPESHLTSKCKHLLLRVYNHLTPRQQRIVSGLDPDGPHACAAVSPRTRKALGGASCESMRS